MEHVYGARTLVYLWKHLQIFCHGAAIMMNGNEFPYRP